MALRKPEPGIPLPPRLRGGRKHIDKFESIKDGESLFFADEFDATTFSISLRQWLKRRNLGTAQLRKVEGGWRVWRNGVEQ